MFTFLPDGLYLVFRHFVCKLTLTQKNEKWRKKLWPPHFCFKIGSQIRRDAAECVRKGEARTPMAYAIFNMFNSKESQWDKGVSVFQSQKIKIRSKLSESICSRLSFFSAKLGLWPSFCRKLKSDFLSFSYFLLKTEKVSSSSMFLLFLN